MAMLVRHGGESHVVRPDRVYRTSVLTPIVGFQPDADVQANAQAFTQGPPSGMTLDGLGNDAGGGWITAPWYYYSQGAMAGLGRLGPIARWRLRMRAKQAARHARRMHGFSGGGPDPRFPGSQYSDSGYPGSQYPVSLYGLADGSRNRGWSAQHDMHARLMGLRGDTANSAGSSSTSPGHMVMESLAVAPQMAPQMAMLMHLTRSSNPASVFGPVAEATDSLAERRPYSFYYAG